MKKSKMMTLLSLFSFMLTGCSKDNPSAGIKKDREELKIVSKEGLKKERNAEKLSLYQDSARQSLSDVSALWEKKDGNHVFSPTSYLIAVSSLLAVSSSVDAYKDALRIPDPKAERRDLLSSLNGVKKNSYTDEIITSIKTAAFYQQIGDKYRFDKNKQEKMASEYVDSGVTDALHYLSQAQDYFAEKIGLKRKIPDLDPGVDAVLVYGGLTRKDCADLVKKTASFTGLNGISKSVDAVTFGDDWGRKSFAYYKGENYKRMSLPISSTTLEVILPDEGVGLKDIDIKKAYIDFKANATRTPLYGYVPFFKIKETINLTDIFDRVNSNKAVFCSGLLKDDVDNDLRIDKVIQSSDFSFSDKGVEGESITVIYDAGAVRPEKHPYTEFNVNCPFYAISSFGGFPLFVNQVVDPVFE